MASRPSLLQTVIRSFPVGFGLILALVGVPFLYVGYSDGADELALRRHGIVSQGTVTDKRIERTIRPKKGGGADVRTTYLVRYRFTAAGAASKDGEQAVKQATWESLTQNGGAAIRYLPGNTALNRLDVEPKSGQLTLLAAGGLLALGGGAMLAFGLLRARRTRALLRRGEVCNARIVRMDGRTVRGRTSYVIHYTYRDATGASHDGRSFPITGTEASGWKVGDVGRIRIDPSRPALSAWVGEGD